MNVKSEREVAQSCPILSDPMDSSLPGSSIHGVFQARVLEWGAIAFSEEEVRDCQKFKLSSVTRLLSDTNILTLSSKSRKTSRRASLPTHKELFHFA